MPPTLCNSRIPGTLDVIGTSNFADGLVVVEQKDANNLNKGKTEIKAPTLLSDTLDVEGATNLKNNVTFEANAPLTAHATATFNENVILSSTLNVDGTTTANGEFVSKNKVIIEGTEQSQVGDIVLDVKNGAKFQGNVTIETNPLQVGGTSTFLGVSNFKDVMTMTPVDASAGAPAALSVTSSSTFAESVLLRKAVTLEGDEASGGTKADAKLDVHGTTKLRSAVTLKGDDASGMNATLEVYGPTTIRNPLYVGVFDTNEQGNRSVTEGHDLEVSNNITAWGNLLIKGQKADIQNNLCVFGNSVLSGAKTTIGLKDTERELEVWSTSKLQKTLTVNGESTFNHNVSLTGGDKTFTVGGPSTFNNTVKLDSSFEVDGESTFNNSVLLSDANKTFTVSGPTTLNNTVKLDSSFEVDGESTFNNNVLLSDANKTFTVSGPTTLNNELVVDGNAIMNRKLTVRGDLEVQGVTTTVHTNNVDVDDHAMVLSANTGDTMNISNPEYKCGKDGAILVKQCKVGYNDKLTKALKNTTFVTPPAAGDTKVTIKGGVNYNSFNKAPELIIPYDYIGKVVVICHWASPLAKDYELEGEHQSIYNNSDDTSFRFYAKILDIKIEDGNAAGTTKDQITITLNNPIPARLETDNDDVGIMIGDPHYAGMIISTAPPGSSEDDYADIKLCAGVTKTDTKSGDIKIEEALPFDAKNFLSGTVSVTDTNASTFTSTTLLNNDELRLTKGQSAIAIVSSDDSGGCGVFMLICSGTQENNGTAMSRMAGEDAGEINVKVLADDNEGQGRVQLSKENDNGHTHNYSVKLITV